MPADVTLYLAPEEMRQLLGKISAAQSRANKFPVVQLDAHLADGRTAVLFIPGTTLTDNHGEPGELVLPPTAEAQEYSDQLVAKIKEWQAFSEQRTKSGEDSKAVADRQKAEIDQLKNQLASVSKKAASLDAEIIDQVRLFQHACLDIGLGKLDVLNWRRNLFQEKNGKPSMMYSELLRKNVMGGAQKH